MELDSSTMITLTSSPSEVGVIQTWGTDYTAAAAALVLESLDDIESDRAERLLDDLSQKGHWGCMEHSGITFLIRVPIFTARQLMRTRTGKYNEYSLRYKRMLPRFYLPKDFFSDVKRASLADAPEVHSDSDWAKTQVADQYSRAWALYQSLVSKGLRKEQARMVLPLGAFTEMWMTIDLRNLLHFLNLRLDAHAQFEMRDLAAKMYAITMAHFPITCAMWEKYGRGPISHGPIQTP